MNKNVILIILITAIIFACKKDKDLTISFTKEKIDGVSQKGPFVNGSSLTLYELDENFSQTGKSFNTQILDNLGSFEISNINIQNSYAKLKADGYYFNEIKNVNSSSTLTLYAISDLTNKTTVNVNLLSTLEVSRIEYLITHGSNYNSAKQQAQSEVLNIFSIHKSGIPESELLDISQDGDNNAILLAVSLIIQGYRTEAELAQLLGDISTDIRQDGILNSSSLGSSLINDAKLLSLTNIRSNLENKYLSLGASTTIPNFEKYISHFIDSTNFIFNKFIQYPFIVNSKQNLIKDSIFTVTGGLQYSIGAYLPIGTSLKILVKGSAGNSLSGTGVWSTQNIGWTYNNYFPDSMVFKAIGNNQTVDIPFQLGPPTSLDFLIYENNSEIPTRTKTVQY